MAERIATKEAVFEAADELTAAGVEPSTITVRAKIGGSYTTVQKLMAEWRIEKLRLVTDIPPEVGKRAEEFAKSLFAIAKREASTEFDQIKKQLFDSSDQLKCDLSDAHKTITSLESTEMKLGEQIEKLRNELAKTKIYVEQTAKLQNKVITAEDLVDQHRAHVETLTLTVAKLEGRLEERSHTEFCNNDKQKSN